jgi:hypothetical protein
MKLAFLLLGVTLVLELAMLDGFAALWENAYGEPRGIDEASELPLTYVALVCGGPLALLCGACSCYFAFRALRLRWLRALFAACAWPTLLIAASATHLLFALAGLW